MPAADAERTTLFVSCCQADETWRDRLIKHLDLLSDERGYDVWDDRRVAAGDDRTAVLEQAIERARVALLLVSADYLTTPFVRGTEVPRLLAAAGARGLRIVPVIVHPCAWRHVGWLARLEVRPAGGRPLSARATEGEIEGALAAIAEEIDDALRGGAGEPASTTGARRRGPRWTRALAALTVGAGLGGAAWLWRTPFGPIPCPHPAGTLYEAESAQLSGSATLDTEHRGYSGAGFVSGYGVSLPGTATSFTVGAPAAGSYGVSLCYANASGSERSLSLYVNDRLVRRIFLAARPRWNFWQLATERVTLHAGANTLAYRKDPGDSGTVNLDFIVVEAAFAPD